MGKTPGGEDIWAAVLEREVSISGDEYIWEAVFILGCGKQLEDALSGDLQGPTQRTGRADSDRVEEKHTSLSTVNLPFHPPS